MSLTGKTILVSGGTRGIGKATVELLLSKGAEVHFTYHSDATAAQEVVALQEKYEGSATAYQIDLGEPSSLKAFVHEVYRKSKKVDVLVNNAGIRKDKSLLLMSDEEWNDVINTNLSGTFYLTRAVISYMLREGQGRIVNISSVSGISGLAGQTNYSASKAGMIGFTKALAKEVAHKGISVNAIAPGPVRTEFLKGLSDQVLDKLIRRIPIERICEPEEIAMAVHTLADEELMPAYYTGQVLTIDGGLGE